MRNFAFGLGVGIMVFVIALPRLMPRMMARMMRHMMGETEGEDSFSPTEMRRQMMQRFGKAQQTSPQEFDEAKTN